MNKADAKAKKRRAQEIWERSEEMFAAGDYLTARQAAADVVAADPGGDLARKAKDRVAQLGRIDRTGLYALAGTVVLYLIAWGYALA
ncbi:MAG: hypothetical protein AAFP04_05870 [Myxococcota bacterium]